MRSLTPFVALIALSCVVRVSAEDQIAPAAIETQRQVVAKAVAYLDGPGARIVKDASCINCHHAPLRGWALREATKAGVTVDSAALKETTDAQVQKLRDVQDSYHESQWDHTLSSFFVLSVGTSPAEVLSKEATDELGRIIVAGQSADGSWKAANQFAKERRPKNDAQEVQTMWSVLALSRFDTAETKAARDRGLSWLKSAPAGTTIDARALRVVVEHRLGTPDRAVSAREILLTSQNADGGWGWQPGDPSEAWPTGLALYALAELGDKASGPVLNRAHAFLATTQTPDGSWLTKAKLAENHDMSSYFGTAWAIVGLSRTMPAP